MAQTVRTRPSSRQLEGRARTKKFDPFRPYINCLKPFKLEKPRLQWTDYTSVRQYVISDPPTIVYHSHRTLNTGTPSVVWQQEMEKAYIKRYNHMHMTKKSFQHMNTTTKKSLTINCDPFQELLHTTHISLTVNMDFTPVGMKNYKIKTDGSKKILTLNLLIKMKVMTLLRIYMYQTHYDMHQ